eukprot:TRINITY_DN12289_c0_g1_i13.p2 TRINITY_DN12289_c0_g1~~TRINITY_DN12289_c0_g1_i13.p2  ORF type:complete len:266 (-),score=59.03 TRINITY_DN12289_c0_g1_i13:207-1004(-)
MMPLITKFMTVVATAFWPFSQARLSMTIAATPLEAAYTWTLSCIAFVEKQLGFTVRVKHGIVCKRVLPGCIFPDTDANNFDLSELQPNTFYYALEKTGGKPAHPLIDIFFLTSAGDYVFIDVTGGGDEAANAKAQKLAKWIATTQKIVAAGGLKSSATQRAKWIATSQKKKKKKKIAATQLANGIDPALKEVEERKLYGVVLAPLVTGRSTEVVSAVSGEGPSSQGTTGASGTTPIEPVLIVSGEDALWLLGGLRQVFRWFVNEK